MSLQERFDFDPRVRRKVIFAAILVFLLIAAGLIPLVIQGNLLRGSGNAGEGFVPPTATFTNTPLLSPSPHSQAFVSSNETDPIATPLQKNCTNSAAYWLDHQDAWPALISVGDYNYTKEQAFTYLQTSAQSVWRELFLHLHITLLNLLSGSDPGEIKLTVTDAIDWLNTFVDNSTIIELDVQIGQVLTQKLSDYNNGVIGPGLCEGDPRLQAGGQLTAVFSLPTGFAVTPSSTPSPSASPTSGSVILPPRTPTPTPKDDDNNPPPPATATQPPPPTNTQPPPPTNTQPPPPTNTQPPPPTNTQPPPPTATKVPLPTPTSPPP